MLMLTLQAANAVPLKPAMESFDLRNVKPSNSEGRGCTSQNANEIVVCGSRRDSHRYRAFA
jgi:hypothetical protein